MGIWNLPSGLFRRVRNSLPRDNSLGKEVTEMKIGCISRMKYPSLVCKPGFIGETYPRACNVDRLDVVTLSDPRHGLRYLGNCLSKTGLYLWKKGYVRDHSAWMTSANDGQDV